MKINWNGKELMLDYDAQLDLYGNGIAFLQKRMMLMGIDMKWFGSTRSRNTVRIFQTRKNKLERPRRFCRLETSD